jgi:hypothetical protein
MEIWIRVSYIFTPRTTTADNCPTSVTLTFHLVQEIGQVKPAPSHTQLPGTARVLQY